MRGENPYVSPATTASINPDQRIWKGGVDSVLAVKGLLQRRVIVSRPIEVTVEYFARGLRDRIIVDGATVVSVWPVLWLNERFDFTIPCREGRLPATVRLKIARFSLRLASFEIEINGVVVYQEKNE